MISIIRLILICLYLSSCSFSDPENYRIAKNIILGGERFTVSRDIFEQQQFSFAKVSIGRGNDVIMSLKSINNDVYEWISADGVLIYTNKGIIIYTKGLEHDIYSRQFQNISLFNSFSLKQDFLNPELFQFQVDFTLQDKALINYSYIETDIQVVQLKYLKQAGILGWDSDLELVIDDFGRPVMSEQKIHPYIDNIRMDFYYK